MITAALADRLKKYYAGKVCSIITSPFALSVDPKTYPDWFTLRIDDIDQEVILGTDLIRNTKNVFFFGPQLIGIAEEQVIAASHPDYEKAKRQAETQITVEPEQVTHSLPTLSSSAMDQMSRHAAELKKKWATTKDYENERKT